MPRVMSNGWTVFRKWGHVQDNVLSDDINEAIYWMKINELIAEIKMSWIKHVQTDNKCSQKIRGKNRMNQAFSSWSVHFLDRKVYITESMQYLLIPHFIWQLTNKRTKRLSNASHIFEHDHLQKLPNLRFAASPDLNGLVWCGIFNLNNWKINCVTQLWDHVPVWY